MFKMAKRKDSPENNDKCVICQHELTSKKQLLYGKKCQRFEIQEKLKSVLHPHDFRALYSRNLFPEPRICNLCFVTIKQIPKGLCRLQELLGEPINIKLYKPERNGWDTEFEDYANDFKDKKDKETKGKGYRQTSSTAKKFSSGSSVHRKGKAGDVSSSQTKRSRNQTHSVFRAKKSKTSLENSGKNKKGKIPSRFEKSKHVEADIDAENDAVDDDDDVDVFSSAQLNEGSFTTSNDEDLTEKMNAVQAADEKEGQGIGEDMDVHQKSTPLPSEVFKDEVFDIHKDKDTIMSNDDSQNEKSKRRKNIVTISEAGLKRVIAGRGQRTRNSSRQGTASLETQEVEVGTMITKSGNSVNTETSLKVSEKSESVPGHTRKRRALLKLSSGLNSVKKRKLHVSGSNEKKRSKSKEIVKVEVTKSKRNSRRRQTTDKVQEDDTLDTKVQVLKTDIPAQLSDHSKEKLRELIKKVTSYISARERGVSSLMMIRCSEESCDHAYPLWRHLALHIKYYHYDGKPLPKDEHTQKMSMLADETASGNAELPYKCSQDGCDLVFSSTQNLQMHESVHGSPVTHICGYPDCGKGFKLLASLQVHYRTHTGERPYTCNAPDCGRSFKHRGDLTVHQRRHTGEKPHKCDHEGCGRAFTTSTELIEHKSSHEDTSFICDLCTKKFVSRRGLYNHKRKMHAIGKPGRFRCHFDGCSKSFVRKDKLELHLCTHSVEHWLYCEKCGKQFGCQRYLDVHYKVHEKNEKNAVHPPERNISCEVSSCDKKFTSRVYMKRHVISYHLGRRPKPVPGVFHTCDIEGCGKQFTLKATLARHKLLVHKGGDYKLNRKIVKYPCKHASCHKEFNRKNLLEEHMVMEHGKIPKRLLPQQIRELDYMERICSHCGMVLTAAQLSRHEAVYHSAKAVQERKESPPYMCHMKGCEMTFTTLGERHSHVTFHIENPPYKCEVEDCRETFFLLKNLDNHLWNHSKKVSICDVDGCSETYEDQLQLAKHSSVHYGGKMKCPWRNCGNWFTAMGTLKQHFLAHSRSLKANFGADFVCDICDRVFSSKYGLKNHKKTHEEEAAGNLVTSDKAEYTCEEPGCHKEFSQHKDMFDHFLQHYTSTPTPCGYQGCPQIFPTMLLQAKHGKSHYDGKYRCPWQNCSKTFASSFFQVKKHVYRHLLDNPNIAADRPYSCSQCDMVFRFKSNLTNHLTQHSEKSDYVCSICGKKFHHNHLKRHMLTHRQEKPHDCPHCGVRYGTTNGLKFHILQKHNIGVWPHKCDYCGKGFISSTELRRHLTSHTKEKPFACEICRASFATHTGYKGHMRKHTGEKYICDVEGCGKVYTTPLSLRGHKAQHAGFSKTCPYCGKVYKNPYGHKCKASRDAKKKPHVEQGTSKSVTSSSTTLQTLLPAVSSLQHPVIMQPPVAAQESEVHHTARNIMLPSTIPHPHMMPHNIPQGLTPAMPQSLPQGAPAQGMMQNHQSQPVPMEMTRATPMNMPRGGPIDMQGGDYTFSNYVVFWDSQTMPQ